VIDDRPLPGPYPAARERAQLWLVRELERSGGRLASAELERRAEAAGITSRTLRRARHAAGVLARPAGGQWFAVLPESPDPEVS
jgi:hypothetical protein